jgi:membrane-bound lytic murein transglycosylase A
MKILSAFAVLILSACAAVPPSDVTDKKPELNIIPSSFSALPDWRTENFIGFSQAYKRSCDAILKKSPQSNLGSNSEFGKAQEWQIACRKFAKINQNDPARIRTFFEQNFIPYEARADQNPRGLFTGYFEAALNGSRTRKGPYQTPLRARPDDLVMVNLGEFRDELKGQRIAGRVISGRLKPYETHEEIINGELPSNQDKALVWVDDPVDRFFLQIQGSGIVALDDGTTMRVGYAGQNGHVYYAVGRELVKTGAMNKEEVSMQSIKQWMKDNPSRAQDLMVKNKSYVFFREIEGEGPIGGQGVALTAERSLAIDHSLVPYGMPVWLSVAHPTNDGLQMNRLMVTQDTGGAIRGPVRGDYFWGYGDRAEYMAGKMRSQGRYWFLLPKSL